VPTTLFQFNVTIFAKKNGGLKPHVPRVKTELCAPKSGIKKYGGYTGTVTFVLKQILPTLIKDCPYPVGQVKALIRLPRTVLFFLAIGTFRIDVKVYNGQSRIIDTSFDLKLFEE